MFNNKLLKELRKYNGLTQEDVAKLIQKSQQSYAFYETGRVIPDFNTCVKLANIFGITINEFNLKDSNENNNQSLKMATILGRDDTKKENLVISKEQLKALQSIIKNIQDNPEEDNF